MMLAQSVFRFSEFITVSVLVASVSILFTRLFLRFAVFLVTRPWRRHRTFTFHRWRMAAKDHSSPPYCVVCLQEAEEGENMRRLTICRHCFHANCIDTWLGEMSKCPLCRAEIPPLPPENPLLSLFFPAGVIDLFTNKESRRVA
ncbi:PREDICTED: putative RING-H2 finger protein ATL36 [Camelina sativa]|uniref:RING-H2 finger protein ATL36 n=1 Tax=Camelina sativa TaxID=90675 RepID=A0ABM0WCT3_CAMSA|nr:PREDICTED: putative RING-H2 finger protein ATL36 [Camelina sativa]